MKLAPVVIDTILLTNDSHHSFYQHRVATFGPS